MTPQREEAGLDRHPTWPIRLLTPYAVEYRYDDEAPELLSAAQAQAIVAALLTWGEEQIRLHR